MAHIPDGVLSAPVLIAGAATSAVLVGVALRRLDYEHLPQAAVLSAAFFVSSLISVPVGPSSVHLLLNGLMGLILGWTAVPALLVALLLQAVFFGHGGLVALGVNLANMAVPALLCAWGLRPWLVRSVAAAAPRRIFAIGAAAGASGVLGTALMLGFALWLSDAAFGTAAKVIAATMVPLAVVESAITGTVLVFLARVDPRSLPGDEGVPVR